MEVKSNNTNVLTEEVKNIKDVYSIKISNLKKYQ